MRSVSRTLGGIALMLSPPLLATPWLHWSGTHAGSHVAGDWITLAVVITIGLAGVWLLPLRRVARALLSPAYAVLAAITTFAWALTYACGTFGSCL